MVQSFLYVQITEMVNFRNLEGQPCYWSEFLAVYDYKIAHHSDKSHGNVDALSRRPCEPFRYCDRVEIKDKAYQTSYENLRPCCHQQSQDRDNNVNRVRSAKTFQKSETKYKIL